MLPQDQRLHHFLGKMLVLGKLSQFRIFATNFYILQYYEPIVVVFVVALVEVAMITN